MQPLLTIGIPTYKRKEYLQKCLESCFAQEGVTPGMVQIVVSDNASNDGTKELLEELLTTAPEGWMISAVYHDEEIRPVCNWNECLERAEGEFFLLLSDDDLLDSGFFAALSNALHAVSDHVAGCMFGYREIDSDGKTLKSYENKDELVLGDAFFYRLITRQQRYHWCSFVSRTAVLKDSKVFQWPFPGSGMFADGAGLAACCASGKILRVGGVPQIAYRIHNGNDCRRPDVKVNTSGRDMYVEFVDQLANASPAMKSYVRYWCADGYVYQMIRWKMKSLLEKEQAVEILSHMRALRQQIDWESLPIEIRAGFWLRSLLVKIMCWV